MANKGGGYERDICRALTLWWTKDPEQDVLWWRTSQSGGRTTTRAKKGKRVGAAHVGDITAVEPEGMPLTRLVTIEIKRGYPDAHLGEIIETSLRKKKPRLETFLAQTIRAQRRANTPWWMLIVRRDHKKPMVYVDEEFVRAIREYDTEGQKFYWPNHIVRVSIEIDTEQEPEPLPIRFVGMLLDDFLAYVRPKVIKAIFSTWREKGNYGN